MKKFFTDRPLKAIIAASGFGTRLAPASSITSKHLLSILNQPMLSYPLRTIKNFGIKEIVLVVGGKNIGAYSDYLGSGKNFDLDITYKIQDEPKGIAQVLSIAKNVVGDSNVLLILGDNFFADSFENIEITGPTIFLSKTNRPEQFGIYYSYTNRIIEKPKNSESNLAVTGLYIYDYKVFDFIETLKPSLRGELEITDVNNWYLSNNEMNIIETKMFWSDLGTVESKFNTEKFLIEHSEFRI